MGDSRCTLDVVTTEQYAMAGPELECGLQSSADIRSVRGCAWGPAAGMWQGAKHGCRLSQGSQAGAGDQHVSEE